MISVDDLTVEFSAKPLFRSVSFVVNERDRIALVATNGRHRLRAQWQDPRLSAAGYEALRRYYGARRNAQGVC